MRRPSMRNLFILLSFAGSALASTSALAAGTPKFGVTLEPIVGYELAQALVPTQHSVSRLIYGGRLTVGVLLFGVEAEYTHGAITESFPGQSVTDTGDKAKLGLRSTFGASLLSFHLRAGIEAMQRTVDQSPGGRTVYPIVYRPYAGAGAGIRLGSHFNLTASVVAVFTNFSNLSQTEYQATAGFVVRVP